MTAPESTPAWEEIRTLFDEVIGLPPTPQAERLAVVGATAPALRLAVERLLAADADAYVRLAGIESALPPHESDPAEGASRGVDPLGLTGRTISHFRVLEPIAVGGMGVVYRAEDVRLGRAVALKLPLPERCFGHDARERFVREGRAIAALDHPNVCAIHEVGESSEGYLFLAMTLYQGETLAARLARDGALPVPDALEIARAIARGLGAAHSAGIVHRDVKPANLMLLPDGGVRVLDFGLAKATDVTLTAPRSMMGTASYMAPEQIRGGPTDARADVWALGVLLYEMLTGKRPFGGESDVSIAHAIVHDEPLRPRALRADVPPELERLVGSLLQKDPALRPATATAAEVELAAVALGTAPRLMSRLRSSWRWRRSARRAVGMSIVGLVLLVTTGAIAREMTRRRARATVARVAAPPTSNAHALEYYLRAYEYERRPASEENLRGAQSLYERAIALDSTFALAHARLAMTLAGLPAGDDNLARIRREADAALRLQPGLGEGHLALGQALTLSGHPDEALAEYRIAARTMTDGQPDQVIGIRLVSKGRWQEAIAHLERATRLDSRNVDAPRTLAGTQLALRRYDDAARTLDRVIELAPDDYAARLSRASISLWSRGNTDTLAAVLQQLPPEWDPGGTATWSRFTVARVRRDPRSALAVLGASRRDARESALLYRPRSLMLAQTYAAMGDRRRARPAFAAARAQLENTLVARPTSAPVHVALGLAYAGLGLRREAVEEAKRVLVLNPLPGPGVTGGVVAATAAAAGAAEVFAQVGESDAALALLERLLGMPAGRQVSVAWLQVDPTWDPLRNDPRFERLLQRFEAR